MTDLFQAIDSASPQIVVAALILGAGIVAVVSELAEHFAAKRRSPLAGSRAHHPRHKTRGSVSSPTSGTGKTFSDDHPRPRLGLTPTDRSRK